MFQIYNGVFYEKHKFVKYYNVKNVYKKRIAFIILNQWNGN